MAVMRRRPARYVYLCYLQIEIIGFLGVEDGEDIVEVDESVLWMATLGFLLKLVRVLRLSTPGVLFLEKVKGAEPGPVFRLATLGFFLEKQVRVFF